MVCKGPITQTPTGSSLTVFVHHVAKLVVRDVMDPWVLVGESKVMAESLESVLGQGNFKLNQHKAASTWDSGAPWAQRDDVSHTASRRHSWGVGENGSTFWAPNFVAQLGGDPNCKEDSYHKGRLVHGGQGMEPSAPMAIGPNIHPGVPCEYPGQCDDGFLC